MQSSSNKASKDQPEKLAELRRLLQSRSPRPQSTGFAEAPSLTSLAGLVGSNRLIDCLAASPGSGCGLVALKLCLRACQDRGELVVVDRTGLFFPPAAIGWGVDARRLLLVTPSSEKEALAAVEIALRSHAVSAVWASLGSIDARAFRRLLLATEAGGAFCTLVRSGRHESQPSWGDVQLRVAAAAPTADCEAPLDVRVTQRRNRHGPARGETTLTIDWRTGQITELQRDTHVLGLTENARRMDSGLAGTTRTARSA